MNTPNLEEKIRKVMKTMTWYRSGKNDKWYEKGFAKLERWNPDGLYKYWRKKIDNNDPESIKLLNYYWDIYLRAVQSPVPVRGGPIEKYEVKQIKNPPSIFEMAKNVTKAAARFVKSGMKTVSQEELEKRLNICKSCVNFDAKAFNGTGKCKLCGCSTHLKLSMATEKCPIDKWLPTV
jgi:hypothetical protein